MQSVAAKTCRRCERHLPASEFRPNARLSDGLHSWCRDCQRQAVRRSRAIHGAKYNEARRRRPLQPRTCAVCGQTYTPRRHDQRRCSTTCGSLPTSRNRRIHPRVCERCGAAWLAAKATHRYCSKRCSTLAYFDRIGRKPKPPPAPAGPKPVPKKQLARLAVRGGMAVYLQSLKLDPCSYCGSPGGQRDHIVPRKRAGGETGGKRTKDIDNLTGSCAACNAAKRDQSLLDFLLTR